MRARSRASSVSSHSPCIPPVRGDPAGAITARTENAGGGTAAGESPPCNSTPSRDRHRVGVLRTAGLSVTTGTVNHAALLPPLLPLGLDAITSDSPHELRAALGQAHVAAPLAAQAAQAAGNQAPVTVTPGWWATPANATGSRDVRWQALPT